MFGASRFVSPPVAPVRTLAQLSAFARLSAFALLSALALLPACAGGDPGAGSGNPFTSQGGGTTAGSTGGPTTTETGGGSMTASTSSAGSISDSDSATTSATSSPPTTGVTSNGTSGTTAPDPDCIDVDGDTYGENCDAGPDCDDNSFNSHMSCGTCVDADMDGFWVGCDQYGPDAPGPDCDDADPMASDGMDCECAVTPDDQAADSCSEGPTGSLGAIAEGGVVPPLKGSITGIDNGPGNGQEDWYWVEFPEAMAMGPRPNAGKIIATFAVNPGDPMNPDYRLEVYTACNKQPFEGLSAQYGPGAPPAREWDFFDAHMPPMPNPNPNPNFINNVPWPAKVYIRVIRVNNDQSCSEYTLQVSRQPT